MATWVIYLVISGVIGLLVVWTMALKKHSIHNKLSWSKSLMVVSVIALAASLVPSALLWNEERATSAKLNAEATHILSSIQEQYGDAVNVLRIEKPEDVYLVFRSEDGEVFVSALVEGSPVLGTGWIEFGTLETREDTAEDSGG